MAVHIPLMLAGPLVRRVEPNLVAVWGALGQPRAVRLSVWDAPVNAVPGDSLLSGPPPLMQGDARTLRIGERLHIAVVVASSDQPLLPGHVYSYNIGQGDFAVDPFAPAEDLSSLKLLRDPPASSAVYPLPHLALGYETGRLPSFASPPALLLPSSRVL